MLAVRNLTENNETTQQWIKDLKPQKPVPSADLEKQGLKLVFDQVGRMKRAPG